MLDKMKEIGSQALIKTNETISSVTSTVTSGVDSLNEKAVRASTAQMYKILEIALEELKDRPLSTQPLTLTSSVNIGIASLELQIQLNQTATDSEVNTQTNS